MTSGSTGHPSIILKDVTLRVDNKPLFERTHWTIRSNEHWAVLGANGSGKSLLVGAICRKIPLLQGQIEYDFDHGQGARTHLRPGEIIRVSHESLGDLLQGHGGYHQARWQSFEGQAAPRVSELLTGKHIENRSAYEAVPSTTDEASYRVKQQKVVSLLGIGYLLDRKILYLSHGESRKVLIARALMQSPKLLIFDDPFRGLDRASRENLRRAIDQLIAEGAVQVMIVTARKEDIPDGITHILFTAGHRVAAKGPRGTLLPSLLSEEGTGPLRLPSTGPPPRFPVMGHPPAGPPPVLIEMNRVSVQYGDVTVLHEISWCMRRHERWAVLGPNGAGKTTLLSLVLADNPQGYACDLTLFGRKRGSGESIWDIKRHIGWVSPELQLYYYRNITCQQVVCSGFFDSIGLYRDCSEERQALARQWMAALAIAHLADRRFRSVSAGEQRLVLLARALVKHPALLVLDEPCLGLDAVHRRQIRSLLDELCRRTPISLIYVTHQTAELPDAITHVLTLSGGRQVS
jgi:molybdate transport system ATP-binding protein